MARSSTSTARSVGTRRLLHLLLATLFVVPTSAVFIDFTNCLSQSYQDDTPIQLQFVPKYVDAKFDTHNSTHALSVTVYGNVTGQTGNTAVPGANDTEYWNSNSTIQGGKIEDIYDANTKVLTTLFEKVDVLTYEPWNDNLDFCDQVRNGECPLGPIFDIANASNPYDYHSFGFEQDFNSTYAFTSFTTTFLVKNGDTTRTPIACVSASITPALGASLSKVIKFLPVVILILVGIATAFAGIFSPWGSNDTFRWTTNYGRDADLLRLVTPGFGDCLQYIQFVALTGSLTLNYPGFYQPIVSQVSWSTLMFNQSFVSGSPGVDSLVDGIYVTHGKYGLDIFRQLVGMGAVDDIWAGMAIWLLVIIAAVLASIQIGFVLRWVYRQIKSTPEEDLRHKNMPFSVGNVIRIVFSYFLLPIVALSMFQLVVATSSPAFTVALAVVMLLTIIGFAVWLLFFIGTTRPKSFLFDDLSTVLTYGSLYNTYSDNAATFALVPVLLTFVRGIAIGAVQPSGIAQLVLLAICEVITVLTLYAFHPFHSPTSMNAYHTFFSVLRFTSILMMVAFAPSLGVTDGPKGWIGYVILLMHAIVLILGFLLNAIQTIVEVAARMAGAGGDESGAARGGLVKVFGMRQLSRRLPRRDAASRQSHLSSTHMLGSEADRKSFMNGNRHRSQSAGSTGVLLNRQSTLDTGDPYGPLPLGSVGSRSPYTPTHPVEPGAFSYLPAAAAARSLPLGRDRGPILGINTAEAADPYYRPPRYRRPTIDAYSPGVQSRASWASGEWGNRRWSQHGTASPEIAETFEGLPVSGRNSPAHGVLPPQESPENPRRSKADYSTREVDFYYGVRGPALNGNVPNRRTKTGPADPTGIPASAAGWFKGLFTGKTKEKGKGFEVVRSSRMPANMKPRSGPGGPTPPAGPEGIPVVETDGIRNGPIDSDSEEGVIEAPTANKALGAAVDGAAERRSLVSSLSSDDDGDVDGYLDDDGFEMTRISDAPPMLPGLGIPEDNIDLPYRYVSNASSKHLDGRNSTRRRPSVPRKSSRRKSARADLTAHLQASGPSRYPFDDSLPTDPDMGHSRQPSNLSDYRGERPTSLGHVNHSIRVNSADNHPEYLGSSAEIVDRSVSGASSMDHSRH